MYTLADAIKHSGIADDPALLSKPFPLEKPLNPFDECVGQGTYDEYYERIEDDEEYYEEVLECGVKFNRPNYVQGSLYLCDYGGGIDFRLPVSGPESGNIWVRDLQGDFGGIFPVSKEGAGQTRTPFLTWHEKWLDAALFQAHGGPEPEGGYFDYST